MAGHRGDITTICHYTADPAPVVRAAALTALARAGALTAGAVVAALADSDPAVRRRAAELAAGQPGVPLVEALGDPDPSVVEAAAWAIGERGGADPATVGALTGQAGAHPDPRCREASVAALGALGDPAGLGAILAATRDKPAVRRRAVLALAAFDGPEVEAALLGALQDRDWQVRQAAEDLRA